MNGPFDVCHIVPSWAWVSCVSVRLFFFIVPLLLLLFCRNCGVRHRLRAAGPTGVACATFISSPCLEGRRGLELHLADTRNKRSCLHSSSGTTHHPAGLSRPPQSGWSNFPENRVPNRSNRESKPKEPEPRISVLSSVPTSQEPKLLG